MGDTLSILVVEDNEDNQQFAQIILEREGYRVDLAATSAEVRQRINAHRPDLILMDVHLGLEDGLVVALGLKPVPATPAIPLVALTALAAREHLSPPRC